LFNTLQTVIGCAILSTLEKTGTCLAHSVVIEDND